MEFQDDSRENVKTDECDSTVCRSQLDGIDL